MSAISSWISQVVLLILLAIVLELLLPNDSFQKYVRLVVGLVLIVSLLSPVVKVLHMPVEQLLNGLNPPQEDALKNSINQHKNEIEREQAAYKSNIVAGYMKDDVQEALANKFALTIVGDIQLDIDDQLQNPKVKHAVVVLGQANTSNKKKDNQENSDKVKEIPSVKKVDIQVTIDDTDTDIQKHPSSRKTKELKDVKQFLAKKWGISQNRLTLQLEGGGS